MKTIHRMWLWAAHNQEEKKKINKNLYPPITAVEDFFILKDNNFQVLVNEEEKSHKNLKTCSQLSQEKAFFIKPVCFRLCLCHVCIIIQVKKQLFHSSRSGQKYISFEQISSNVGKLILDLWQAMAAYKRAGQVTLTANINHSKPETRQCCIYCILLVLLKKIFTVHKTQVFYQQVVAVWLQLVAQSPWGPQGPALAPGWLTLWFPVLTAG